MRAHDAEAAGRPTPIVTALLLAAMATLAWRAFDALAAAIDAISFLLSLDYGEGIVIEQALLITGPKAYGDITVEPFIVFHYPPIYHFAVRAAAWVWGAPRPEDLISIARIISVMAGGFAVGCVAWLVWRLSAPQASRTWRVAAAAVAAAIGLGNASVAQWMPIARVDMLALAFSMWGLALAATADGSLRRTAFAVICFTLAVFTKQTALAAPLAVVSVLLLADRRSGLAAIVLGITLGLIGLGVAQWLTDGGFLRHIVGYNINRFTRDQLRTMVSWVAGYMPLIAVAMLGLASAVAACWPAVGGGLPARLTSDFRARGLAIVVVHFGLCTMMLPLIGKSGSNTNYLLEWLCSLALLTGIAIARLACVHIPAAGGPLWLNRPTVGFFAGCLLIGLAVIIPDPRVSRPDVGPESHALADDLVRIVRDAGGPVISDDMVLVLRSGKRIVWEPAIFAELASLGRWDEALVIERIRDGRLALAVTEGVQGSALFDSRYSPNVAATIANSWPVRMPVGWLVVHRPAQRAP